MRTDIGGASSGRGTIGARGRVQVSQADCLPFQFHMAQIREVDMQGELVLPRKTSPLTTTAFARGDVLPLASTALQAHTPKGSRLWLTAGSG